MALGQRGVAESREGPLVLWLSRALYRGLPIPIGADSDI